MPFDGAWEDAGFGGEFLGVVFAEVGEGVGRRGGGGQGLVEGEDCGGGVEFRDGGEADLEGGSRSEVSGRVGSRKGFRRSHYRTGAGAGVQGRGIRDGLREAGLPDGTLYWRLGSGGLRWRGSRAVAWRVGGRFACRGCRGLPYLEPGGLGFGVKWGTLGPSGRC